MPATFRFFLTPQVSISNIFVILLFKKLNQFLGFVVTEIFKGLLSDICFQEHSVWVKSKKL